MCRHTPWSVGCRPGCCARSLLPALAAIPGRRPTLEMMMPADNTPSISIIIPALNEEHGIGTIVDRVLAANIALKTEGIASLEVIVVDDGSHDQTAAVVE